MKRCVIILQTFVSAIFLFSTFFDAVICSFILFWGTLVRLHSHITIQRHSTSALPYRGIVRIHDSLVTGTDIANSYYLKYFYIFYIMGKEKSLLSLVMVNNRSISFDQLLLADRIKHSWNKERD